MDLCRIIDIVLLLIANIRLQVHEVSLAKIYHGLRMTLLTKIVEHNSDWSFRSITYPQIV